MNKKYFKSIIVFLMMLCMAVTFVGCGKKEEAQTKFEKIQNEGKLVLGTAADYPPYEFHKEIDGKDQIVGFDIEIAKETAKELGVELEIKDMKFEGLLAALVADKIDLIVAGMVPTEERAKSVDFSKTYYEADQKLLIRTEDKDKLKSTNDFKGLKVGAQKATTQEDIVKKQIAVAEPKFLGKITDLVLELKNNKIDGVVLVGPVADAYAKQNEDMMVTNITFDKEPAIAIAVNKGNKQLLESINKTLDKLKNENSIKEFIKDATKLAEPK